MKNFMNIKRLFTLFLFITLMGQLATPVQASTPSDGKVDVKEIVL